jgi:hypothetical protein
MKKILLSLLLAPALLFSQEDLLSEIDIKETSTTVESAFKSMKIVNLESTKLAAKGDFYFIVSHRFGSIKGGAYELFGLDQASTNFRFLYGVNKWLNFGASRGSSNKTYDLTAKYRLLPQSTNGSLVTIAGFNSIAYNSIKNDDLSSSQRLSYVTQLLVSRKFSEKFSFQVSPTYFHQNYVDLDSQKNSQYAVGVGGRYKLTSRWALNADYAAHLNRAADSPYKNPLSIGVDLETGGHVFQMHFTNSRAMNETGFLSSAEGDWSTSNIFFGFNLVRVF